MKKLILILVCSASLQAQNQIFVTPWNSVPFDSTAKRLIDGGSIKLPVEIVPAKPTPLTTLQPSMFLVPATPAIIIPRPAPVRPIAPIASVVVNLPKK